MQDIHAALAQRSERKPALKARLFPSFWLSDLKGFHA
jgi:hypothetical protein